MHTIRIFELKVLPSLPIFKRHSPSDKKSIQMNRGKRMLLHWNVENTFFSIAKICIRLNLYLAACVSFVRAPDFGDKHFIDRGMERLRESESFRNQILNQTNVFDIVVFLPLQSINRKTLFINLRKTIANLFFQHQWKHHLFAALSIWFSQFRIVFVCFQQSSFFFCICQL